MGCPVPAKPFTGQRKGGRGHYRYCGWDAPLRQRSLQRIPGIPDNRSAPDQSLCESVPYLGVMTMAASQDHLSLAEARRIALAAQGFDTPRPNGRVAVTQVRRVMRQLSLVQLDYVNVLVPAHYQVFFSRLGPYARRLLDEIVYRRREFLEQWAHEASLVPMDCWPLLGHRRAVHRVRPYGFEKVLERHREYADWLLNEVRARGPLTADELPAPEGTDGALEQSWHKSVPRAFLEAHFGRGLLAVAKRLPNFARAYDLAERIVPAEHHGRVVDREAAQRELLLRAARAHGIGTAADLADYYRMSISEARPRLAELVEEGKLDLVRVEEWREPAYRHPEASLPRRIDAAALLSPFDPVIWFRPRVARLFGVEYRVEIFVPEEKRRWGYYVLPFLFGERIVARVDLRADRRTRRLVVRAAHREDGVAPGAVAEALAVELRLLADWLELDTVLVEPRGDFAGPLATAVAH